MNRPSSLQIAQKCGLAPELGRRHPEGSTRASRGSALHAGLGHMVDGADHRWTEMVFLIGGLPADDRQEVGAMMERYRPHARVLRDLGAKVEVELCLNRFGNWCQPGSPDALEPGHADAVWVGDPADPLEPPSDLSAAVVLDHKTSDPMHLPDPEDSLQLGYYALAWGGLCGFDRYRVGYCFHDADHPPRYSWSPPLGPEWAREMRARVVGAALAPPVATTGDHCSGCFQRRRCPSWMLPAMSGAGALMPFANSGVMTPALATQGLHAVKAARDVIDLVEARIKDYADEVGGIPDGQGRVWIGHDVEGRRSASVEELLKDGLRAYVREGRPYRRYGWRKA